MASSHVSFRHNVISMYKYWGWELSLPQRRRQLGFSQPRWGLGPSQRSCYHLTSPQRTLGDHPPSASPWHYNQNARLEKCLHKPDWWYWDLRGGVPESIDLWILVAFLVKIILARSRQSLHLWFWTIKNNRTRPSSPDRADRATLKWNMKQNHSFWHSSLHKLFSSDYSMLTVRLHCCLSIWWWCKELFKYFENW